MCVCAYMYVYVLRACSCVLVCVWGYSIDQNTSFNIPIAEIQLDASGTVARSHKEIGWEQALKENMA